MRVGAFGSHNVLGIENHGRLFSLHAALVLPCVFIALLYFAPSKRPSASLRLLLAGVHVVAALLVVFASESRTLLLLGSGACAAVTALFALLVLDAKSWSGALFLVAAVAQVSAWAGTMVGWSELTGATLYPLVLATLAAPLLQPRASPRPLFVSAVLAYLLARTAVRFLGLGPMVLVELIAGLGVAAGVIRSAAGEPAAWLRWGRRTEGALFAQAVLLTSFLGFVGGDVHLNDTLFAVGATHFEALVLVFAFLRALVPVRHTRWGSSGLLLAAVGAHVFCWGAVVVGSRGMPRRYAQHLGQFNVLQAVASVGALTLCVGALAMVSAYLASRKVRAGER